MLDGGGVEGIDGFLHAPYVQGWPGSILLLGAVFGWGLGVETFTDSDVEAC
jgi:hypothetical protein